MDGAKDHPRSACTLVRFSASLSHMKTIVDLDLISDMQSFTYALYDLCVYPEYTDPLREEIGATLRDNAGWQPESMPRLDSFLKKSSRLNPSDSSK